MLYSKTTNSVKIEVNPHYVQEASSFERNIFSWSYSVVITNNRKEAIQLINRIWYVEDSNGNIYNIKGKGVVGEQPVIFPKDKYSYQSWTNLITIKGVMYGNYEMKEVASDSEIFLVEIPKFDLQIADNVINFSDIQNKK